MPQRYTVISTIVEILKGYSTTKSGKSPTESTIVEILKGYSTVAYESMYFCIYNSRNS